MILKKEPVSIEYRNVPWNISFLFLVKKNLFLDIIHQFKYNELHSANKILPSSELLFTVHDLGTHTVSSWSPTDTPLTHEQPWQLEFLHRQLLFQANSDRMACCLLPALIPHKVLFLTAKRVTMFSCVSSWCDFTIFKVAFSVVKCASLPLQ